VDVQEATETRDHDCVIVERGARTTSCLTPCVAAKDQAPEGVS